MNKKGFTLIELIGIIVILSLVITITATSGFGLFNTAKDKITEENINSIKEGANILIAEVNSCDEKIDNELKSDFGVSDCESLKSYFANCVEIRVDYLINNDYVSGSGVESILEDNPDATIKVCNGKFSDIINIDDKDIEDESSGEDETLDDPDNPFSKGTLAYKIYENKALVEDYDESGNSIELVKKEEINEMPNPITDGADDAEDSGIFTASDDDGTSYVFRGTVRNNYVDFAGFTWRIVRINGDGTIRLILDGTLDKVCNIQNSTVCTTAIFNESYRDSANVGYMYGLTGMTSSDNETKCLKLINDTVTDIIGTSPTESACNEAGGTWTTTAYEATHANIKSSTIKKKVDSFYEAFLQTNYSGYLGDSTFCGDKTPPVKNTGYGNTSFTYYGASDRLWKNSSTPTLKCNGKYSRYSVSENLTYPIALLNADELVFAGAFMEIKNHKYYLYNSSTLYSSWWTLAPYDFNGGNARVTCSGVDSYSINANANRTIGVRPVINLGTNVLYNSGDGTEENKYTVK